MSMMKLSAVLFSKKRFIIDTWQGSKGSVASLFKYFSTFFVCILEWIYEHFVFFSESVRLLCSCDVNQKYYKRFQWFPNYLLSQTTDQGKTKFSYIYTIRDERKAHFETRKDEMQGWYILLTKIITKTVIKTRPG